MTQAVAAPRRRMLDGWQLCSTAPGRYAQPQDIDAAADAATDAAWVSAPAGTVASMLRSAGLWSLDGVPRRFDAEDWWLRASFDVDLGVGPLPTLLHLEGLAGLADVWLNGHHLLRSENMFVAHACPLQPLLRDGSNVLHLRFASLDAALAQRRPRPRWRTPMIEHQQLRWLRQTPLGRTPGWSPPAAAVGPWREVWLETPGGVNIGRVALRATLDADGSGTVHAAVTCEATPGGALRLALELARQGRVHAVELRPNAGQPAQWEGQLRIDQPALWWPHTHGEPALYDACLRATTGTQAEPALRPLAPLGFRSLSLQTDGGDFALQVNGVPVFCRGACWMPLDVTSLRAEDSAYAEALAQVRDAGMNMLRVSGATVYEDEPFFRACDAAGVLVWQDFMFANMDYPADDPAFAESVRVEAAQQLERWRAHPSLALLCGNSEVEQQAAMWGAPRELWSPPLFHERLRGWCAERLPDVPYWPSSAHGGAFPHQADSGTSSYYGVGAYLRAPDDARRARVRFSTECLGFANVPEPATIERMPHGAALRVHHPAWKARAPRDLGAGWDFEDVRDHYLAALYGVDPLRSRYADHERYLSLGRVVTGDLMADAFAEWRRPGSGCRGALVWFLRDLWAGAGWGLQDDMGRPKACWYMLRRSLQPRALFITDEGGNGLTAHLQNEPADAVEANLRVSLFGAPEAPVAQAERRVPLAGRGAVSLPLAELFDDFFDLSYSYRFGPPGVTLVHVQWRDAAGRDVGEAFHFPAGRSATATPDMPLAAGLVREGSGTLRLRLEAHRFVQSLQIELDGYALSDNHFHMAPGSVREVQARPLDAAATATAVKGWLRPLNSTLALPLRLST